MVSKPVRMFLACLLLATMFLPAALIHAAPSSAPLTSVTPATADIIPIGKVQGVVDDSIDGAYHRSPYAPSRGNRTGETYVTVQGVVYQKTLARTSRGGSNHGFFIQNTDAMADDDSHTSDGIFVYMGRSPSIDSYTPQVGDEIIIRARVSEFYNFTELMGWSAEVLQVVRTGVDLNTELPPFEADPPLDLEAAARYWERREGMRAQVPAGSTVLGGRDVFASTLDGEVWVARDDVELTQCAGDYARRAFRDPFPCDNNPSSLFDDGNGYRILMGSLGLKGSSEDSTTLIAPARTFDKLVNEPSGGVYYSYGKYSIQVTTQPVFDAGADPSLNAPPQPRAGGAEYTIATYNVENLYDYRDDPFDGCDFPKNSGCPGVYPPFNYAPASQTEYQAHLEGIATQIVNDLHAPDIVLVQEAEDQDICRVSDGTLVCGTTNNADGRPDTLQELTLTIAEQGGPSYDAVYDRDGADDRGIVSAFLFRTDRVELLPAKADDPVLGSTPQVVYGTDALAYNTDVQNPKALNAVLPEDINDGTGTDGSHVFTRPPQVGRFRVWQENIGAGEPVELYAVSNHFSSGPDRRVSQRREQAAYNAAIVAALQSAEPQVRVVVGGDFNVFPRPDDPFAPNHWRYPSDQLAALYEQGLANLWDVLVAEVPSSAYSYVFQGQAQTLDQIFVTDALFDELLQTRVLHINADWPASYAGDGARGVSDHDPQVARFGFPATFASSRIIAEQTTVAPGQLLTYRLLISNTGRFPAHYTVHNTLDRGVLLFGAPGMSVHAQTLSASGTLDGGSTQEYIITVRARRGPGYTIHNTAILSGDGQTRTLEAPEVTVVPPRR